MQCSVYAYIHYLCYSGHHEVHHIVQMPVVGQPQKSNPSTSTEVVGDIRRNIANSPTNEGNRHLVALCTLDGMCSCTNALCRK